MKRVILGVLIIATSLLAASQHKFSNQEIAKTIMMSKQANQAHGVFDPNKINPGQQLTFLFADGAEKTIIVESGDSQWKILRDKLSQMIEDHGDIQDPNTVKDNSQDIPLQSTDSGKPWYLSFWVLIALVLILAILSTSIYKDFRKERTEKALKNPVTSGSPMKQGGVQDEEARTYMQQVANRAHPYESVTVTNIERGQISGKNVAVFYAGKKRPERKTFENITGYRGIIQRSDNTTEAVYFLQGCGNDVRAGNYFKGSNVQFTPDSQQPEVLRPVATQPVQEEVVEKTESVPQNPAMVSVLQAATTLIEPLSKKDWGKVHIEAEGVTFEINFGTGSKSSVVKEVAQEN